MSPKRTALYGEKSRAIQELFERDPLLWFHSHAEESWKLLVGESPRGAGVLARAYLETIIDEFLLRTALVRPDDRQDIGRALATGLKGKIVAYKKHHAIDETTSRYMSCIRQIGDRYAHHPELRDFDGDEVLLQLFVDLRKTIGSIPQPELTSEVAITTLGVALGHVILNIAHAAPRT